MSLIYLADCYISRVNSFSEIDDIISFNELLELVFAIGIDDKGAFTVEAEGYGF